MSPLDDELHKALHTRAGLIAPPADPLGGIERRARGIKRRRLTATLAGGALALAAAGVAVPALLPDPDRSAPQNVATSPTPAPADYSLDPASPWAARGTDPSPAFRQAWLTKHPGTTFSPLFSQVYEPSQQTETAFVSDGPDGARFGYAVASGSTTTFWYDDRLPDDTSVLAFLLPGDEVRRLVAVAAPGVTGFGYGGSPMTPVADGVAVAPVTGAVQELLVRGPGGSTLFRGTPRETSASMTGFPSNLLTSWPQRGEKPSYGDLSGVPRAFAEGMGRPQDAGLAHYRELFVGNTGKGEAFTVGQAWFQGEDKAYNVSYSLPPNSEPDLFLGKPTPAGATVLAFTVPNLAGMSDLLVVVPAPGAGQVLYDTDGTGAFQPVTGQDQRDGVVLIDRSTQATSDRLQVLDGNGDYDHPMYEGPVAPLLCGLKECG
jgi:hypothetical protein